LYSANAQMNETAIIKSGKLNVRSRPEKDSRKIMVLRKGTKVEITGHTDGWLKILHKGKTGYIRQKEQYVRIESGHIAKEAPPEVSNDGKVESQKETESIKQKIQDHRAAVQSYQKKEGNILNSLNRSDKALNHARNRKVIIRGEIDDLSDKIKKASADAKNVMKEIDKREKYSSARLISLYKIIMLGKINIVASAGSLYELSQRKAAMEKILSNDEKILTELISDRNSYRKLLEDLNKKQLEKLQLEASLKKQVRIISKEKKNRAELLSDIQNEKSIKLAAIDALRRAAENLDQTINSFEVVPAPSKRKTIPLKALKGLLKMPVKGKIVTSFGSFKNPKYNVVNFRSGIDIKAPRGEPIRAVHGGKVIFSSWLKGYGNMIIVDHGYNYYTVYAHIEKRLKEKGEFVETEEKIGTVGDTGSLTGSTLYFEVRHHGKPLDPKKWLEG